MRFANDQLDFACLPAFEPKLVLSSELPLGRCHFVIDTTILGRSWGGIRIADDLSLTEVRVLARTMTVKTILAGIPIGGAKAGIALAAKNHDREAMLRQVYGIIAPYVKNRNYIPATDIGFTETDVNSLYDFADCKARYFVGEITVGEACAKGIAQSLRYVAENGTCRLGDRTVALEGFGRIGVPTAKLLALEEFRIVAVSDIAGTLYDPSGLDVSELATTRRASPEGFLSKYSKGHVRANLLPREALFSIESEVLIPGARALTIDDKAARRIKAKVVCPISNAPVTLEGEEMLARRGIVSVPDIISNTGGMIASFAQHLGADKTQTEQIISEVITGNLRSVFVNLPSGMIPKKLAVAIATDRLRKIKRRERIGALRFLAPWIKALGLNAMLVGFKQYIGLKV
jgi:glutamate dehydrogenase (NAD(P)+)